MKIQLQYTGIPISDNKLYSNIFGQSRRFLSSDAKRYKAGIELETRKQLEKIKVFLGQLEKKALVVYITIRSNSWLTQSGSIRKKDIQNHSKAILDSIFTVLQESVPSLDDSQIFSLIMYKELLSEDGSENESTYVEIESID